MSYGYFGRHRVVIPHRLMCLVSWHVAHCKQGEKGQRLERDEGGNITGVRESLLTGAQQR